MSFAAFTLVLAAAAAQAEDLNCLTEESRAAENADARAALDRRQL